MFKEIGWNTCIKITTWFLILLTEFHYSDISKSLPQKYFVVMSSETKLKPRWSHYRAGADIF